MRVGVSYSPPTSTQVCGALGVFMSMWVWVWVWVWVGVYVDVDVDVGVGMGVRGVGGCRC